jgi:hypothetical protein
MNVCLEPHPPINGAEYLLALEDRINQLNQRLSDILNNDGEYVSQDIYDYYHAQNDEIQKFQVGYIGIDSLQGALNTMVKRLKVTPPSRCCSAKRIATVVAIAIGAVALVYKQWQ